MRKTILAMFAALALAISAVSVPAVSGSGLDGSWIIVRESSPDAAGGRGDYWKYWKSDAPRSVPDLNTQSGGLWLGCDNLQNDWNNCITAVSYWIAAGSCIRFFDGQNYATALRTISATTSSSSGLVALEGTSQNNKYTSFRWGDNVHLGGGTWSCRVGDYD